MLLYAITVINFFRSHKMIVMGKFLKLLFLILFFLFCDVFSISAQEKANSVDWNPVMDAIIQVESEGNLNAKSGNSVGVMQITPILVADCNHILKRKKSKKRYRLPDRFNLAKSKQMFLLFQSYYNPMNDIEKAIRMWNGGIHYSVKRTQRYFGKVMKIMK